MNEYREDKTCYFHPKEVVIGVCAVCLNERLVILAEKQGYKPTKLKTSHSTHASISLQKVFALGSLLNRLDLRHHKSDVHDTSASTSQEDSFISINFEDNGKSSWEKGIVPKVSLDTCDMSWSQGKTKHNESHHHQGLKSVMEKHATPRSSLRWRKRIGHLFQLVRWKRSSKGNVCHVNSKLEGVKVRHGWIRTLTKKRTKE